MKRRKTSASELQLVLALVLIGSKSGARLKSQSCSIVDIVNQSKLEVITCSSRKALETRASESRLVLALVLARALLGFHDLGRSVTLFFFSKTDFNYNYLHIVQK